MVREGARERGRRGSVWEGSFGGEERERWGIGGLLKTFFLDVYLYGIMGALYRELGTVYYVLF